MQAVIEPSVLCAYLKKMYCLQRHTKNNKYLITSVVIKIEEAENGWKKNSRAMIEVLLAVCLLVASFSFVEGQCVCPGGCSNVYTGSSVQCSCWAEKQGRAGKSTLISRLLRTVLCHLRSDFICVLLLSFLHRQMYSS